LFTYLGPGHIRHVNNTGMANESLSHRSLQITHSFSIISANIAINDMLKLDSLDYISVFNYFDVIGPESYRIQ